MQIYFQKHCDFKHNLKMSNMRENPNEIMDKTRNSKAETLNVKNRENLGHLKWTAPLALALKIRSKLNRAMFTHTCLKVKNWTRRLIDKFSVGIIYHNSSTCSELCLNLTCWNNPTQMKDNRGIKKIKNYKFMMFSRVSTRLIYLSMQKLF